MKIATFADLHAHNFKEFDRRSDRTGSERLDRIVDTLIYIRDYCAEHGIEWVIFPGDLFHIRGRVTTIVYNAVYDAVRTFGEYGIRLIIIPGNHDQWDNSDFPEHSIYPFSELKGVTIVDSYATIDLIEDEVTLTTVPYSKNVQMIKDFLHSLTPEQVGNKAICMFHLGISGGFVGTKNYPLAEAFQVEDLRPDLFKWVVGGHFHRKQFLGGYDHVFYCGSPIQHDFGDTGEDRGFFVIDTDGGQAEFIPIPNPKFYVIENPLDVNLDQFVGHYLLVKLDPEEVQKFKSIVPQGLRYKISLNKTYKAQTRVDVKVGMSEEEVVAKYAEEFNPSAKEIGLQILREVQESR